MKNRYLKIPLCIIGFLFAYLNIQAQKIIFTPQWMVQSQFAGHYVADSLGFYDELGLDVKITHTSIAKNAFGQLKEGTSHIITSNLSHALSFNSEGADLVNIMQLSQTNSLILVSHSPLKSKNALRNKTIGVWNYIDQKLLDMINLKSGLNINWVRFNSGINVFLSGAVDIMLITKYNEYYLLKECGLTIEPDHMLKLPDYGYDIPEEGLYVTREYYLKHKEALEKFVRASKRGWEWANEQREETIDMVMKLAAKNNVGTNRYHQRKMLGEILKTHLNPNNKTRTYRLDENDYNRALRLVSSTQQGNTLKYHDFVK